MKQKVSEGLETQEAIENVAAIASIDLSSPPPLGIVHRTHFVTNLENFSSKSVEWIGEEGSEAILHLLDESYRSILRHLESLYTNPEMNWESKKNQKGIAATMELVGESSVKMEAYLGYRFKQPQEGVVTKRAAFQALERFYVDRFQKRFLAEETEEDSSFLDLEMVMQDRNYELFFISDEEGKSYFSLDLLRKVRIRTELNTDMGSFEEDPFLKIRSMSDRDAHISSMQILRSVYPMIQDFYSLSKKWHGIDLGGFLSQAIFALMLAANPRHLLQNTHGKSCLQYFSDFHHFLRFSLKSEQYEKAISETLEEKEEITSFLVVLTHQLCRALFLRKGGIKQEVIGLIHRTMRKGEEILSFVTKGETLWDQMMLEDEKIRAWLSKFPNGPLFQILDLMREEETIGAPKEFDPIGQGNFPMELFSFVHENKEIKVIRLPCPTSQTTIQKAKVIPEFQGWLRSMKKGEKHLLINLQDWTDWKEISRCKALASTEKNIEFSDHLLVLTLPKSTSFYHQSQEYLDSSEALSFFKEFRSQIEGKESCGFSFPQEWKPEEILLFVDTLFPQIHESCFGKRKRLERKERQDFIEIAYNYIVLKAISLFSPTTLSFTSKDGVDEGAAAAALFYGTLEVFKGGIEKKEEIDTLFSLFYAPALFVRERALFAESFHRALSALEVLERSDANPGIPNVIH